MRRARPDLYRIKEIVDFWASNSGVNVSSANVSTQRIADGGVELTSSLVSRSAPLVLEVEPTGISERDGCVIGKVSSGPGSSKALALTESQRAVRHGERWLKDRPFSERAGMSPEPGECVTGRRAYIFDRIGLRDPLEPVTRDGAL